MERKRLHTSEEGFPRRKAHANLQVLTTSLQRERRGGRQGNERDAGNQRGERQGNKGCWEPERFPASQGRRQGNMETGSWRGGISQGMRDGLGTCAKMARLWGVWVVSVVRDSGSR